jgi:hypothetical protein
VKCWEFFFNFAKFSGKIYQNFDISELKRRTQLTTYKKSISKEKRKTKKGDSLGASEK